MISNRSPTLTISQCKAIYTLCLFFVDKPAISDMVDFRRR